jgi:hypothetical protein
LISSGNFNGYLEIFSRNISDDEDIQGRQPKRMRCKIIPKEKTSDLS